LFYTKSKLLFGQGRYADAEAMIGNALQQARATGYPLGVAHDLLHLAEIYEAQGRWSDMSAPLEEAAKSFEQARSHLANVARLQLGKVRSRLGRPEEALAALQSAEPFYREHGTPEGKRTLYATMAEACQQLGDAEQAARWLGEANAQPAQ